jgi:uncharacterized membrane protein YcjF (UPF0283 family)
MRKASLVAIVLLVGAASLFLLQLWVQPFAADTFFKLMVTIGVVLVIVVIVALIRREYMHEKRLRDKGLID